MPLLFSFHIWLSYPNIVSSVWFLLCPVNQKEKHEKMSDVRYINFFYSIFFIEFGYVLFPQILNCRL